MAPSNGRRVSGVWPCEDPSIRAFKCPDTLNLQLMVSWYPGLYCQVPRQASPATHVSPVALERAMHLNVHRKPGHLLANAKATPIAKARQDFLNHRGLPSGTAVHAARAVQHRSPGKMSMYPVPPGERSLMRPGGMTLVVRATVRRSPSPVRIQFDGPSAVAAFPVQLPHPQLVKQAALVAADGEHEQAALQRQQ